MPGEIEELLQNPDRPLRENGQNHEANQASQEYPKGVKARYRLGRR